MEMQKGYYRIKLRSGLIVFGEILDVRNDFIRFQGFEPAAIGKRIPVKNIIEFERCTADNIPAYE